MKHIIAIGGGGFRPENLVIERYILEQTKKTNPKVCFLPQASSEAERYVVRFYDVFHALGAKPSWVSLFGRVEPSWKEKLLEQDVIFVGGGNTRSMLALWREWGVDDVLRTAHERGIVLAGVSAGAICWFEHGITDSVWPMGVLEGLGLLKGSCCPHYDTEPERRPTFTHQVSTGKAHPGIALSDETAAHYIDGKLAKRITWGAGKKAFHVSTEGEKELEVVEL